MSSPPPPIGFPTDGRITKIPEYDPEKGGPQVDECPAPNPHPGKSEDSNPTLKSVINGGKNGPAFGDGDTPKNGISGLSYYLPNFSIVIRWFMYVVPVLVLVWVPAIIQVTKYHDANIWAVPLLWWSIWLTVVWAGGWIALAVSQMLPRLIRCTVVVVGTGRYIDWLEVLDRYIALFEWTCACWISFQPLVSRRQSQTASSTSKSDISLIGKLLFGFFLCAAVLLLEKFSIQWIAGKFHKQSYAVRIADLKHAVEVLVVLYANSTDVPSGRLSTTRIGVKDKWSERSLRHFQRVSKTTATTAFRNIASEIMGCSLSQLNSPQATVRAALESVEDSRLLSQRLYYSLVKPDADYMTVDDIAAFFSTADEAEAAFSLFDKVKNGDVTKDEMELACVQVHLDHMSIEHSTHDLDGACGRLDNILVAIFGVIAVLIFCIVLQAQIVSIVTAFGSVIIALSWLVGGSLTEVLSSIIFLFIKHPYDVGDRIEVDGTSYTVNQIHLLSTVLLDSNNTIVVVPNAVLNQKFILNVRRSPQMTEPFTFDVAYDTSFEQLEALRGRMIAFLSTEKRDFIDTCDISVVDFPEQEKITLKVDIRYKGSCQVTAGWKVNLRNKWICALKTCLADVKIYGPTGSPHGKPTTARYTLVPWELVSEEDQKRDVGNLPSSGAAKEAVMPAGGWRLTDADIANGDPPGDIFGECQNDLTMRSTRSASSALLPRRRTSETAYGISDPRTQTGRQEVVETLRSSNKDQT